ncbi:hypothetical protein PPYR_13584 [Photinus pyralis]|uniref:RNA-directed DNA polymerase n=1 Tax=Photinus pyralis TaxID=7054 RepID=A0A5N4A9H6_PHOPY|nr:hypothetical protein PPYR_13584 [Photinus pyralis]
MDDSIKYYYKFQAKLSVEDGLLFINHRLIVPDKLRFYILRLLHEPHFGTVKTKQRARQIVFWPRMLSNIQNMISNCYVCERYQNAKQRDLLIPHEIPNIPFYKIACDIMDYADYFSKWLEIILLKNKTSSEIIKHLKILFAPVIPKDAHKKLLAKHEYFKRNHDKSAKNFNQNLKAGDNGLMKDQFWEKGQVVGNYSTPRSFNVINNMNNVVRRNFSQLKSTNTKFEINNSSNCSNDNLETINNQTTIEIDSTNDLIPDSNINQTVTHSGRIVKLPN